MGSRCRVSFTDTEGIVHAVQVEAESLYEAVGLAVAEFRDDPTIDNQPAPMTEFTVAVLRPAIEHRIRLKKVIESAQPSTRGGPSEIVKREKLRRLLNAS